MNAKQRALAELADAIAASGLIDSSSSAVVMVSGGADSAATAAGLTAVLGAEAVHASHVNYGLRDGRRGRRGRRAPPVRGDAHRPPR